MNARPLPLSRRTMLFTLLLTGTAAAGAQTVWRCGPQRNIYRQEPCPEGTPVAVDDTRDDGQRRSAEALARREAAEGERLRHEREARDMRMAAAVRSQQPAAIRGVPAVQPSAALTTPGRQTGAPKTKPGKSKKKPKAPPPAAAAGTSPTATPATRRAPG